MEKANKLLVVLIVIIVAMLFMMKNNSAVIRLLNCEIYAYKARLSTYEDSTKVNHLIDSLKRELGNTEKYEEDANR